MNTSRRVSSGNRAGARSRPKRSIVCLSSIGLGLALLTVAWHSFSPFALGVWAEHAVPLFLGGHRLAAFRSHTLASVLLPILAGAVYGLPFATLVPRRSGSSNRGLLFSSISVVATALTGITTGLARLQAPDHGAGLWDAANIVATVAFGVVLIVIAQHARRSSLKGSRAMKFVTATTSCAGFCIASYFLLPGGLLFLVVTYFAFPLACRNRTQKESEAVSNVNPPSRSDGGAVDRLV